MFLWNIAVTSLAEVWIEIKQQAYYKKKIEVTSLAEVWIEIDWGKCTILIWLGHFPCGSVD